MTVGHLGDWIAAQIFDIELETSAVTVAIDGRFRSGPLQGRTVNAKWYLKREGLIDITESPALDYYLVLTGPASAATSSRGGRRPGCIEAVYLFDVKQLLDQQRTRGVKTGIASSVRSEQLGRGRDLPAGHQPGALRVTRASRAAEALRARLNDLRLFGVTPGRAVW